MGGWLGGWLYKHENITNSASNSVEVGAGAELGNINDRDVILQHNHQTVDAEIESTVRTDEEVRHIRDHHSYSISDD